MDLLASISILFRLCIYHFCGIDLKLNELLSLIVFYHKRNWWNGMEYGQQINQNVMEWNGNVSIIYLFLFLSRYLENRILDYLISFLDFLIRVDCFGFHHKRNCLFLKLTNPT